MLSEKQAQADGLWHDGNRPGAALNPGISIVWHALGASALGCYVPCSAIGTAEIVISNPLPIHQARWMVLLGIAHHLLHHHAQLYVYRLTGPVGISDGEADDARRIALNMLPRAALHESAGSRAG